MCTVLISNVAENKIRKKPYASLQDEGSRSMLSRSCEHIFQRLKEDQPTTVAVLQYNCVKQALVLLLPILLLLIMPSVSDDLIFLDSA